MSNREKLYGIRSKVIRSVYWSNKLSDYYETDIYGYAPMIKDELFKSLTDEADVVGVIEMESKLGRSLKIEELIACPLSVKYLTLGNVIVTESEEERETLEEFDRLIDSRIKGQEGRAVAKKIRELQVWQTLKYNSEKK